MHVPKSDIQTLSQQIVVETLFYYTPLIQNSFPCFQRPPQPVGIPHTTDKPLELAPRVRGIVV